MVDYRQLKEQNHHMHMKIRLALVMSIQMACSAQATDYFVATSGSAGNTGTSTGSPWNLQRALTNSTFAGGDNVYVRGGAYTPSGTNVFWWKPYPGVSGAGVVTFKPYRGERVVVDARKFWMIGEQCTFTGLEFTDSSQTNRSNAAQLIYFEGQTSGEDQHLINCVAHDVANLANHAFQNITGCDFLYVGNQTQEHTVYNKNTNTNFIPLYANNVSQSSGGAVMKLIDGGYNTLVRSNCFINAAHPSMAICSYAFWHNPPFLTNGVFAFDTNAPGPQVEDNLFINDPSFAVPLTQPDYPLVNFGISVTNCGPCRFVRNYLNEPNFDLFRIGSSAGQCVMQQFVATNNLFVTGIQSGHFAVLFNAEQIGGGFTWDYNTYYAPSNTSTVLFSKPSGSMTFAAWQSAGYDVHGGLTTNSYGPDQLKVYADYDVVGRGHILVVNHSMATNVAVDLSGLGISSGENYQLAFSQAIHDPIGWRTNTYTTGQNLQLSLRTNDWPSVAPNDATTMTLKPSMPRYGAWLVRPSPKRPTGFAVTRSGSNASLAWTQPSGSDYAGYEMVKRAVGVGGTYTNAPVQIDLGVGYTDTTGVTNGNSYTYDLVATNGYSRSSIQSYTLDLSK